MIVLQTDRTQQAGGGAFAVIGIAFAPQHGTDGTALLVGHDTAARSELYRYDLVTNDNALFTGMNYTAENALLPARNILVAAGLAETQNAGGGSVSPGPPLAVASEAGTRRGAA